MGIRHLARQRALQLLYALEFLDPSEDIALAERRFLSVDPLHRRGWGPFARELARGVFEQQFELDEAVRPALQNWTLERLPLIDRLCLRMAMWELTTRPDIPLRVTINEYIELARNLSTDESPAYVNAVLDRLSKQFRHKDFGGAADEPASAEDAAVETEDDELLLSDLEPEPEPEGEPKPAAEPAPPAEPAGAEDSAVEPSAAQEPGETPAPPPRPEPRPRPRPSQLFTAPPAGAPRPPAPGTPEPAKSTEPGSEPSTPEGAPDHDPDAHA